MMTLEQRKQRLSDLILRTNDEQTLSEIEILLQELQPESPEFIAELEAQADRIKRGEENVISMEASLAKLRSR